MKIFTSIIFDVWNEKKRKKRYLFLSTSVFLFPRLHMENHHKYYGFKEWKFILSTTLDGRNPESRCSQGQDSGNALEEDSILPLLAVSVEFLAFLGL